MNTKLVRFTWHSLERAQKYQVSLDTLLNAWNKSSDYTISKKEQAYKFSKYGIKMVDDIYFYHPPSDILFTCSKEGEFYIVITITKRKEANKVWW